MPSATHYLMYAYQLPGDTTVLYVRRDSFEVVSIDLTTDRTRTITDGAHGPAYTLSPDGRLVLTTVRGADSVEAMLTELSGGSADVLFSGASPTFGMLRFAPSNERILRLSNGPNDHPRALYSIDLEGNSRLIADDIPDTGLTRYVVHPGGWLAAVQRVGGLDVLAIP